MLTANELATLRSVVCTVRMAIDAPGNCSVLRAVLDVADAPAVFDPAMDRLRPRIAALSTLDRRYWAFAAAPLRHVQVAALLLTEPALLGMIRTLCRETIRALEKGEQQRAFDLADAWHNLPAMLLDCRGGVPESFWTVYIGAYRMRWDRTFLREEQALVTAYMAAYPDLAASNW